MAACTPSPRSISAGRDEETDWLLESWRYTLDALPHKPEALLGGVDWISKKWLLETFMAAENLSWNDPWLQSLDLEYHNIDPARGLFFGLKPAKRIGEWNNLVRQKNATHTPPSDTRASGRARAVAAFRKEKRPYVINWDSIACESHDFLVMGDPFKTYVDEIEQFIAKAQAAIGGRAAVRLRSRCRPPTAVAGAQDRNQLPPAERDPRFRHSNPLKAHDHRNAQAPQDPDDRHHGPRLYFLFLVLEHETDFAQMGNAAVGKIYDRNVSQVEFQRNARLLRLASQLGMRDLMQELTTGAQTEDASLRQFFLEPDGAAPRGGTARHPTDDRGDRRRGQSVARFRRRNRIRSGALHRFGRSRPCDRWVLARRKSRNWRRIRSRSSG